MNKFTAMIKTELNTHIDDFLNGYFSLTSEDPDTVKALRLYFEVSRMPAWKMVIYLKLIKHTRFSCIDGNGKRMYLVGCSRMGDIWLTSDPDSATYEVRTHINKVSQWKVLPQES